ncbi:Insulin-like growth factor-binding protein complex acid labile subunit [Trichoplax sp. H2]|nr:Insulin-like growth factor-binding protein complex acid labile subunit [Trichoplax sp. H2]|eukprot:RDD36630.1 Insulin-like growth factor-binding protein complex acid labile subunit [Trichoplax sp. H2]
MKTVWKLSRNIITEISLPFWSLPNLRKLFLDQNAIIYSDIVNGTFQNLTGLELLDLRGNYISTLGNRSFQGLGNLKYLRLADNIIMTIEPGTFQDLSSLVFLGLKQNFIAEVTDQSITGLSNLQHLDLASNSVSYVALTSYNGPAKLQTLNLRSMNLYSLENLNVDTLSQVKEINLSYNQIRSFSAVSLTNLTSLSVLSLRHNLIKKVMKTDVKNTINLNKIKKLDISSNRLHQIEDGSFINAKNLKTLYINDNDIRNIAFTKDIWSLENLYASSNKLEELSGVVFSSLVHLKVLDLSTNNFKTIDSEALTSLKSLEELYLEDIGLKSLSRINFAELNLLKKLILGNNDIEAIFQHQFSGLNDLQVLDLSKNLIIKVPDDTLQNMISLQTLYLNENKLSEFDAHIICSNRDIYHLLQYHNLNQLNFSTYEELNIMIYFLESFVLFIKVTKGLLPKAVVPVYKSLQSNQIRKVIDRRCLGGYTNLRKLNMNNNLLDDTFDQSLKSADLFQYLDDLNIGYNKIASRIVVKILKSFQPFNDKLCGETSSIGCRPYSMYLNDNNLTRIDVYDLFNVTNDKLQELHLANNELTTISTKRKYKLQALIVLNLRGNKITTVCGNRTTLDLSTPNVEVLQLDNNFIRNLEKGCLYNFLKLKVL